MRQEDWLALGCRYSGYVAMIPIIVISAGVALAPEMNRQNVDRRAKIIIAASSPKGRRGDATEARHRDGGIREGSSKPSLSAPVVKIIATHGWYRIADDNSRRAFNRYNAELSRELMPINIAGADENRRWQRLSRRPAKPHHLERRKTRDASVFVFAASSAVIAAERLSSRGDTYVADVRPLRWGCAIMTPKSHLRRP